MIADSAVDSDDEDTLQDANELKNMGVGMSESSRWLAAELHTTREIGPVSSIVEREYFEANYAEFKAADVGQDANGFAFVNWNAFAYAWNVECAHQDNDPAAAKLDMTLKTAALLQQFWQEHLQRTNESLTMEPIRQAHKVCCCFI